MQISDDMLDAMIEAKRPDRIQGFHYPPKLSTAVQNPATRRRKTRPGGSGLRHGARAYQ